jgi:hypothetical protein
MKDIQTPEEIYTVVDEFYKKLGVMDKNNAKNVVNPYSYYL